jgi:hypothetical protein
MGAEIAKDPLSRGIKNLGLVMSPLGDPPEDLLQTFRRNGPRGDLLGGGQLSDVR